MPQKGPATTKFFRVSAALKRLIGRDLITNPYVAVFELVKNSYDAGAHRVDVVFLEDRILIVDDGSGMSADDIENKWLFVAYSGKKPEVRRAARKLSTATRAVAGSKGVGRFAADQLGRKLNLQTRTKGAKAIQVVDVEWDKFEESQKKQFIQIPIRRTVAGAFSVRKGEVRAPVNGTVLSIEGLRESWNREKLTRLRRYLSRLIDPFGDAGDRFRLSVLAPAERAADRKAQAAQALEGKDATAVELVNGVVRSTLLDVLEKGATSITVSLSASGNAFDTTLDDRGLLVYKLREPNRFQHLEKSRFDCRLFYLNQAAKTRFARRMGYPSVQFGSVFLFRNGFRVFPIGEEDNDFFGIDRRKQQGYARYLGTRDLVGRINVVGDDEEFRESTSRDQGLIETDSVHEMKKCFFDLVFRRLETYVTGVTWSDVLDKEELGPGRLGTAEARERIVRVLAGLAGQDGVQLLEVAPDLDSLLAEQAGQQEPAIRALEAIAANQHDDRLLSAVRRTKGRIRTLLGERELAQTRAESARSEKEHAEQERDRVVAAYEEEKKRNLFFAAATPLDVEALQGFLHQIGLQATDISGLADNAMYAARRTPLDKEGVLRALDRISWRAQQTLAVSKFATKANFRLETAQVTLDLAQFFEEYVDRVASVWSDIKVRVTRDDKVFMRRSRPIDISIVVDNLISNARRAEATKVEFAIGVESTPRKPSLVVRVTDDGRGLAPSVLDTERIFERGFTTTKGSGLGLWHVRHAMQESGGAVSASIDAERRVTFLLTFPG